MMFGTPSNDLFKRMVTYPPATFNYDKILRLVRHNTKKVIDYWKIKFNVKVKPKEYKTGDKVLLKTHHLSDKLDKIRKYFLLYDGPYEVIERKMGNAYVLFDVTRGINKGTYNVRQLKKFID